MIWTKLKDRGETGIPRGCVFRFPAEWPYEGIVDLMVVHMPDECSEHALVVSTGHKAGLILVRLPLEAELPGASGLSTDWVIRNWKKWIYDECEIDDVLFARNYSVSSQC